MAGRRVLFNNKVVAVAMLAVVALLALLLVAGEAAAEETCNVDQRTLLTECGSACKSSGGEPKPTPRCCEALKPLSDADYRCLCRKYWSQLKNSGYADCAKAIPSKCNPYAPKSC